MKEAAIPFEKMEGLGNDFILVRKTQISPQGDLLGRLVGWCDRRTGIGADGVLILSEEGPSSFRLEVVNQDGSIPEICGNGIRCATRSWARRRRLSSARLAVRTDAGWREIQLHSDGRVSVEMGPASPASLSIPVQGSAGSIPAVAVTTPVGEATGLAISMGNPHLVLFDPPAGLSEERQLAALEHHPAFPRGANVSLARVTEAGWIALVVWERGCGFTRACGSAACATAAAAVATGRMAADRPIPVRLPGGELLIEVSPDLSRVRMTGPAQWVFTGRIPPRSSIF
ncbi:MAG: diaminopimelate epimerase [Bradymonadales bacterium]|nr:diaminopimelate epimerase [Bradymonadales bacterium]